MSSFLRPREPIWAALRKVGGFSRKSKTGAAWTRCRPGRRGQRNSRLGREIFPDRQGICDSAVGAITISVLSIKPTARAFLAKTATLALASP
jgi:hypothetical protein